VALGRNLAHAFGEHGDFRFSNAAVERRELAIDVGDAHIVGIDEREKADAGARQCLDDPGTYPAHADDAHVRARETLEGLTAKQPAEAAEAVQVIE
jgi:hypothetical protein